MSEAAWVPWNREYIPSKNRWSASEALMETKWTPFGANSTLSGVPVEQTQNSLNYYGADLCKCSTSFELVGLVLQEFLHNSTSLP